MREEIRRSLGVQSHLECREPHSEAMEEALGRAHSVYVAESALGLMERLPSLQRTIESEIIPRLMLIHNASPPPASTVSSEQSMLGAEQVVDFTAIVLAEETAVARAFVDAILDSGTSLESVYLDLLSPVARRLGELWEEDRCNFADVTIGLWRLQQIVYEYEPMFRSEGRRTVRGRRAFLMHAPGDQHSFGLSIVGEFFLRAGWDVRVEKVLIPGDAARVVGEEWFEIAGLSAGIESQLDGLIECVRAIRRQSRNPSIKILVGGPIFLRKPELVDLVGADGTARDGQDAVRQAESLIVEREMHS